MQSAPIAMQPPGQQPSSYPPAPQQSGYPPGYGVPYPGPTVQSQSTTVMIQLPPQAPPGLECLAQVDQLLVTQEVELLEVLTSWQVENKYKIRNALGQELYFAAESSNCFLRQYWGSMRPFEMSVTDHLQREVIHMVRPFRCRSWLGFCCLQKIEVQSPPGTVIGYVQQDCSFMYPSFSVQNAEEETAFKIKGPCFTCRLCQVEFEVLSSDETQIVGKICKQWSGLAKEIFTNADNFGIQFPMDLDVKMKATMLAACFLIDFLFYDNRR